MRRGACTCYRRSSLTEAERAQLLRICRHRSTPALHRSAYSDCAGGYGPRFPTISEILSNPIASVSVGSRLPAIVRLASKDVLAGSVLDAGYGTGEDTLHITSLGATRLRGDQPAGQSLRRRTCSACSRHNSAWGWNGCGISGEWHRSGIRTEGGKIRRGHQELRDAP
jgi:hypothetical protein